MRSELAKIGYLVSPKQMELIRVVVGEIPGATVRRRRVFDGNPPIITAHISYPPHRYQDLTTMINRGDNIIQHGLEYYLTPTEVDKKIAEALSKVSET